MKKTSDDMMRSLLNLKEDYTLDLGQSPDQLIVEREQLHEDDDDKKEDDKPEEKKDDEASEQENDESNESGNDEPVDQENDEPTDQVNDDKNDQENDTGAENANKGNEQPENKNQGGKEEHALNMVPNVQKAYEDLERAATASDVAISVAKYLNALKDAAQDAISKSH